MNRLRIILKSGATIEVDAEMVEHSSLTTDSRSLRWATPDGWTEKLCAVDLDEIAAVVAVHR